MTRSSLVHIRCQAKLHILCGAAMVLGAVILAADERTEDDDCVVCLDLSGTCTACVA